MSIIGTIEDLFIKRKIIGLNNKRLSTDSIGLQIIKFKRIEVKIRVKRAGSTLSRILDDNAVKLNI